MITTQQLQLLKEGNKNAFEEGASCITTHLHTKNNMKSERLLSLDILRGITIVGMILVNNPGTWESIYAPLRHAEWNGLTPTDLVFPFFMFIMGVSMSFALSRFDHHFSRGFIIKLVRRTVILFLLGLFLSWFSLVCTGVEQPFSHIRILGVLQRLALAYFFGSLLIVGVRRPANLAWISGIILAGYSILLALGHGFELSEQNIIAVQIAHYSEKPICIGSGCRMAGVSFSTRKAC